MKIGLSFSQCVKEVLEGKVPVSEVLAIVAGTKMETEAQWESVIERYSNSYWRYFSDPMIKSVVDTLRPRIIQSRMYDMWPPAWPGREDGCWINI